MNTLQLLRLEQAALTSAGNLLAHTRQCPACFPAFATGGKLGSACAAGQTLRVVWVESIEAFHLNKEDCKDNRCDYCSSI